MKEEIKVKVPTSWNDITLRKYLLLQADLETYDGDNEACDAALFNHLCDFNPLLVKKLSVESYNLLKTKLNALVNPADVPLTKFVKIGGKEYGFEPNLSTMSYGAYADLTSFDIIKIDKDWAKIMNILFRPVVLKANNIYEIEPYNGDENWERWLDITMDIHFGAWFFFLHLQKDLLKDILSSMKEVELPPNIKSILAASGKLIQHYTNWQEGILKK